MNMYYNINIYFSVLDNTINGISARFEENNFYALNCMQYILLNDKPNII